MKTLFRWLKNWFDGTKYKFVILANYFKHGAHIKKELRLNPQPKLSKQQRKEINRYFAFYGLRKIRPLWHQFYGGHNKQYSKKYIPQDLFFSHIEMALNRYEYTKLQDKNILDKIFDNVKHPNALVKNINGFYQKEGKIITENEAIETIMAHDSFIIKPSIDTSSGNNIQKLDFSDDTNKKDRRSLIERLYRSYGNNFIVQEVLDQSKVMKKLNPSSLNTIRICTYLREEGVAHLFSVVRFGSKGGFLDNISQGGFYCVINDDGSLDQYGYSIWKNAITETDEGIVLQDFEIPNYEEVKETAKKMHQQVPYFRLISWDIGLDRSETPVLIELNIFGQSIDFQASTGPLFGEHTDEALALAQKFRK